MHGIGRGREENIVNKVRQGNKLPSTDGRRNTEIKKKCSEEDLNNIKGFIEMFPNYESHYSHHKSPHREHLNLEYSVPL